VGDAPDREGLIDPRALPLDDDALEGLDALPVALDDLHVHPDGVAGPEGGNVIAQVLALDLADNVGHDFTPYTRRSYRCFRACKHSGSGPSVITRKPLYQGG